MNETGTVPASRELITLSAANSFNIRAVCTTQHWLIKEKYTYFQHLHMYLQKVILSQY